MQKEILEALINFFKRDERILVAYLFGSYAKKTNTSKSDIDIAILLSETLEKLLDYHLYLINKLSEILGDNLDLIILNIVPPMLKYQVIKHGKIIYSRNEQTRIIFEAKAQCEYLDFSRLIERYNKCLMKHILT